MPASIWIPVGGAALATAAVYLRGFLRLRRSAPEITAGCRPSAFLGGLLVFWIVVGSPLSMLDHRLLTFHMLQHLLLMTVAAPLFLLGSARAAFLRGLPPVFRSAVASVRLRSSAARQIGRTLTHPIVCWMIGTGIVIAWHVPPAHELGMRSLAWHLLQQLTFFAAGLLFWWPVLIPAPSPVRSTFSSAPLYSSSAPSPATRSLRSSASAAGWSIPRTQPRPRSSASRRSWTRSARAP